MRNLTGVGGMRIGDGIEFDIVAERSTQMDLLTYPRSLFIPYHMLVMQQPLIHPVAISPVSLRIQQPL